MTRDIVAAAGFGAFILVGLAGARLSVAERARPLPPRRIQALVALGVVLSLFAGLSRRDLWPFANWTLMPGLSGADVSVRALVCADSTGTSVPVDHRAWAPLTEEELLSWVNGPLPRLPAPTQDSARAALLRMAESARLRVRSGGQASAFPSILGPLAASSHLMHPALWNHPADTPAQPCVAVRFVERSWNVDSVAAGRGRVTEQILWQYPAAR